MVINTQEDSVTKEDRNHIEIFDGEEFNDEKEDSVETKMMPSLR